MKTANNAAPGLSGDALRLIVPDVLRNLDRLQATARESLVKELERQLSRSISDVKPNVLCPLVINKCMRSPNVNGKFKRAWMAIHDHSIKEVDTILEQYRGASVTTEELKSLSEAFATEHLDLPNGTAELLFQMRLASRPERTPDIDANPTVQVPPDSESSTEQAAISMKDWIDEWEALPPEDSFWDSARELASALVDLTERKLASRPELLARQHLIDSWAQLRTGFPGPLAFFGIPDFSIDESGTDFTASSLGVERLGVWLERFWALYNNRPPNADEYRKNRSLMDAAETEVIEAVKHLKSLLNEIKVTKSDDVPSQTPAHYDQNATEQTEIDGLIEDISPPQSLSLPFPDADTDAEQPNTHSPETTPLEPLQELRAALESSNALTAVPDNTVDLDGRDSAIDSSRERPASNDSLRPFGTQQQTTADADPSPVPDRERWNHLMGELLADGDISGAFWLARGLLSGDIASPIPVALLEALLVACNLDTDPDSVSETFERIATEFYPGTNEDEQWISLAAVLRPAAHGMAHMAGDWVKSPRSVPGLSAVTESIRDLVGRNVTAQPSDFAEVAKIGVAHDSANSSATLARQWIKDAPTKCRGVEVWGALINAGPVSRMLRTVADNATAGKSALRKEISLWSDPRDAEAQIQKLDPKGPRGHSMNDNTRERLLREIREAVNICQSWCDSVDLIEHPETGWTRKQLLSVRKILEQHSASVTAELSGQGSDLSPGLRRLLADQLTRLFGDFGLKLALPTIKRGPVGLAPHLAGLMRCPQIPRTIDGSPTQQALASLPVQIEAARLTPLTVEELLSEYVRLEEYRFGEVVIEMLPEAERAIERRRFAQSLEGSRQRLGDSVRTTEATLAEVYESADISQDEYELYNSELASIHSKELRQFSAARELVASLDKELRSKQYARLSQINVRWTAMLDDAPQLTIDTRSKLEHCFRMGLDRGTPPVLEEFLAQVEARLHSGQDLNDLLNWEPGPARTPPLLKDFLDNYAELEAATVNGPTKWNIANLQGDAQPALEAWGRLSSTHNINGDTVQSLLIYLGFGSDKDLKVLHKTSGLAIVSVKASTSSDDARPFAVFGSDLKALVVVAVWGESSPQTVVRVLQDKKLQSEPAVVFYLGSLTVSGRRLWAPRESGVQNLPLAVLDNVLFAHICRIPSSRLKTFLHCSLPFAALNPYNYYGFVQPEMFFGREDLVNQLAIPSGPSIIFGGRQLGKSALLDHLQRRVDNRDVGKHALILSVRDAFLTQPTEYVWQLVRDSLVERKIVQNKPTVTPEATITAIKERVSENCSILLMIDEADSFFEADSRREFREVNRFAVLMSETGKRFRVIFAGTNSVMRYQSLPNHPLVQFGDPVCLGPLEPAPARRLVREPLEALGFKLTDVDAMQVLSHTNYHPGLIQLFCKTLLERVYSLRTAPAVPYELSSAEIDNAKLAVREAMCERFNLTLGLDKNNYYRVIACALILDQLDHAEAITRVYPPRELLGKARQAWPAAFDIMSEEIFRSKVVEMVGMGVLSQNRDGDIRLRSPRIAPLMGTPQKIRQGLEEIADKAAPPEFDADSYHIQIDNNPVRYSPFTFAQESNLNRQSVGLIFATDASGFGDIAPALDKFRSFGASLDTSVFETVPQSVDSVERWLTDQWPKLERSARIVCLYQLPHSDGAKLADRISAGMSFIQKHEARNRATRLLFVFDSEATWRWSQLGEKRRTDLEKKLGLAIVRPWSLNGMRQRLAVADIAANDDTLKHLRLVTGGWHILVDELLKDCKPNSDLAVRAESVRKDFWVKNSELSKRFLAAFGFDKHPELLTVVRALDRFRKDSDSDLALADCTTDYLNLYLPQEDLQAELTENQLSVTLTCLERLGCIEVGAVTLKLDRFLQEYVSSL